MRHHDSLVGRLLAYASAPDTHGEPIDWHFEAVEDREFEWVIAGGLGPLLYHATSGQRESVPARWRDALLAANLTARVHHANRVDVTLEILVECARAGIPCTLLKGISTSEQFYPSGHLRPMGDIDVLVPAESYAIVESALLGNGRCKHHDEPEDDERHHGAPLHDTARDVWIEIHRSLFPAGDEFCPGNTFSAANVAANSVHFVFRGLPALRLDSELQLVYTASSWMHDLTHWKIDPSFLASIFDAVFLLVHEGEAFDWSKLMRFMGDDIPTASLHVMLTFLASRGLASVPRHAQRSLEMRQQLIGALQLKAIHAMLDRYLIGGRRWAHALPPPVVGRYSVRRQWAKRIARRVGTRSLR